MTAINPSPSDYWQIYVYPDYKDFSHAQGDLRKAMHAALSSYHFHDWIWHYYVKNNSAKVFNKNSREEYLNYLISNCCPDFGLLNDVVTLHKHLRRMYGKDHGLTSHTAREEHIEGGNLGSFTLGSDRLGGDAVFITLNDGSERIFFEVVRNVIEMWEKLNRTLQIF